MVTYAILFVALIIGGAALLSWPLGRYMKWAMDPDRPDVGRAGQFTQVFQRIGGSAVLRPQDWKQYIVAMLLFNALMFAAACIDLVLGALLVLVLGIGTGLLPAFQASRLKIVDALRRI